MISKSRFLTGFTLASLIFGSTAFAIGAINTNEGGYLLCVNNATKVITFPGSKKCPKGSTGLVLGAQGIPGAQGEKGDKGEVGATGLVGPRGEPGLAGPTGNAGVNGINGVNGAKGSSLLTGVGVPSNSLGENGDTYIDKNAAQIYGPKSSGIWGYGIGFSGPAGARGPMGLTGPSEIYLDYGMSDVVLTGNAAARCYTSDFLLPSGNYAVMANVDALNRSGSRAQFNVHLRIGNQESPRVLGSWIEDDLSASETVFWAFTSVPANSNIEVWCDSSGAIEIRNVSILALLTEKVTSFDQ